MTRDRRIGLALFCIALIIIGCGRVQETPVAPAPVIATVDWDALWRAHPLAAQWRQKQSDRLAAQRALTFQEQLLQQKQRFDNNMMTGRQQYSEAVAQTKMAELAAEKREMLLQWEQQVKAQFQSDWLRAADEIEDKYRPELSNLQLKLAVLNLPKADKQQLETAHAQLLERRDQELRDKRKLLERQLTQRRKAEETRLSVQLAVVSDKTLQASMQEADAFSTGKDPLLQEDQATLDAKRQALLIRIEKLKTEEAALAAQIESDIRAEAERLGSERKFGIIMRNVVVNVNAVDITQELVKAVQLRAKTQK